MRFFLSDNTLPVAGWLGPYGGFANTTAERTIRSESMAIWYQSDKFLYVSRLQTRGPVAIDIGPVRGIRYLLNVSVQVSSGGRIDGIPTPPMPEAARPSATR